MTSHVVGKAGIFRPASYAKGYLHVLVNQLIYMKLFITSTSPKVYHRSSCHVMMERKKRKKLSSVFLFSSVMLLMKPY